MKRLLPVLGMILLLTGCGLGYGPLEDHSEFVSAQLAGDRRTVVFTFHRFTYCRATGWRAFPDGGIPKYVEDANVLGTYDRFSQKLTVLRREENSSWQPGSGLFTVNAANGAYAVAGQGGQLRGPFRFGLRHLLVDLQRGKVTDLDLKGDLAARGRDLGPVYLPDETGLLLFLTLSPAEAKDPAAYRDQKLVPEIWVRTPAGEYLKAAASAHYERVQDGQVIYWDPATRLFFGFSVADRATRPLPGYKVPGYRDVTEGAIVSSDRQGLEFGLKVDGKWKYQRLGLTPEMLK